MSMSARDTMPNRDSEYTRRRYIKGTGAASAAIMAGFAGCTGGGGGSGNGSGGNGSGGNGSGGGGGGGGSALQVLHGWTGGDGATAVESLIQGFNEAHSDVNANFQAIGGGGNTNLDTTISNRAQNGNLPSTWADWPGLNLVQFTEAGLLGDISDNVWTDDLRNNYSAEAKTYSQVGEGADSVGSGPYVAVPLGSHRMNDFFYNVNVVEEAGVDPTSLSQPSDIVGALQQVDQNTDAVGMAQAHAAPFTTLQLWEVVMQGQAGYQAFMDFINGNGDEQAVRSAFELIQQFSQYYNSDVSSISFTEANQKFINGDAAFVHNGNWVAGAYRNQDDFEYESDWNHITFPGTEDMYGMHLDSFPMPAEGPAAEAARTFLSYVGTTDAQVRFNQYKGSIPPRTDAPTDAFGPYLTQTIEEYNTVSNKPPTIAHGLAVLPGVHSDMDGVITDQFRGSGDIDAATQGMLDAVSGSN
jgi:glucose/mannose transport system substrate-binding protein